MRTSLTIAGMLVFVAACGKKDNAAATDSATAAAPQPSTATAAAATPDSVTVHMTDFAFAGPAQIPAGMTTITAVNDGKTLHHVEIVRLDSGRTVKDLEAELAKPAAPPTWAVFEGGPNAADPGTSSNATLELKPGSYAMICVVDVPGGIPHFAKGMVKPFTVTAAPAGQAAAAAPAPDVTITLADYAFNFSAPVTAGRRTFEVTNSAKQPHEIQLVRLAPGKTVEQLLSWLQKPAGPPPGSAIGGIAPMMDAPNYFTADMTPGNYALICFVPDAKDGKPHFTHGMIKSFTVS